jgi:preprotein translocase subunit YajC
MLHPFLIILADTAAAPAAQGPFSLGPLVPIGCLIAVFYFMAIRPQAQRQKQLDALIKSVKTGDKIVTSSGIHGLVSNVKETTLIVKIADNVKIELDKSCIGSVKRDETAAVAAT